MLLLLMINILPIVPSNPDLNVWSSRGLCGVYGLLSLSVSTPGTGAKAGSGEVYCNAVLTLLRHLSKAAGAGHESVVGHQRRLFPGSIAANGQASPHSIWSTARP